MVDLVDSCEWKHERNDNNWLGTADEISVSYFASDSAAAYKFTVRSWQQGKRIPNVVATEFIRNLGASSLHGSKKCADTKTVLDWFRVLVQKKNVWQILGRTALGPCALHTLHTLHTLLLRHWTTPQTISGNGSSEGCTQPSAFTEVTSHLPGEDGHFTNFTGNQKNCVQK